MYYSPLEQFEPIPYLYPLKLGFFYIFGTNVTYILILLLGIFFFINGSFWSIINFSKINDNVYSKLFYMNSGQFSFLKVIFLPFNFLVYFYKNIIFFSFFKNADSLFKTIPSIVSILLINYKKNLFRSLNNYSIKNNYSTMYRYINSGQIRSIDFLYILPFNFNQLKSINNKLYSNFFFYFLRVFYFFSFFFKK